MFCTSCGAQVAEHAHVCLKCGVLIGNEEAVPQKSGTASLVLGIIATVFAGILAVSMLSMFAAKQDVDGMGFVLFYMIVLLPGGAIVFVLSLIGLILGLSYKRTSGIVLNAISIVIAVASVVFPIIFLS